MRLNLFSEIQRLQNLSFKLEALSVYNGWARFIIFLFGDPHLLEGGEGSQDGATNPYRVLSLWWGDDLDLHGRGSQGADLLLHTVGDAWVHGGATRQHGVGVQVLTDVDVTLHDGVVGSLVDTSRFHTYKHKENIISFKFKNRVNFNPKNIVHLVNI